MGGAGLLRAAGAGGLAAIRAGTAMGSAASTAFGIGRATSGATGLAGVAGGVGGIAGAGVGAGTQRARSAFDRFKGSLSDSVQAGTQAALRATGSKPDSSAEPSPREGSTGDTPSSAPDWARRLRAEQRARHTSQLATQAVKEGDRPGAPANPELDQEED